MAYTFDPITNTLIDDEDKSLGNKFALNTDEFQKLLDIPGVFKASDAPQPPERPDVQEIELFNRFNRDYPNIKDEKAEGGMIRQNFGDGTPTKRADGQYSVRLKDFSKPLGPDGRRPRITYIGSLSYIKDLIKKNKKEADLARLEQGIKSSKTRATWLKDYSLADYETDIKNGKTRLEIANDLYNKNKAYYDDLNKKLFDPNNPTSVSRIQAALTSRTQVGSGGINPETLKKYNTINKLANKNVLNYEKELKKAHNAAKTWINKNKSKYKKTMIPGQVTGTLTNFEKDFYKYMNDNFSRFVRYTTGTTNAPIKNLPYIDRFSEAFDYKASNQGMHRIAALTELKKGLGIFKERGLEKSKSFERRQGFIKKLLPIAQKNGVLPKYWTPKGGKFFNKKIPLTAANYQTYVDSIVVNPMNRIFGNLVRFSAEHTGGMSRAAAILDSDALDKVVAMEFGEKGNANLYKGRVIDTNIGDALEAAMNENPNNKKKIKEHINVANDFANKATKKYGIVQAKYNAVVEDGKIKIKATYPKISLNDTLLNKTKNAINSFIANDGMNRDVFNELPEKLKKAVTLINNNKNADAVLKSHIKDIFPEEGKGVKLNSFAGVIDFDLIPDNVKATVAKGANALGKSLRVLGVATAPLDVIPFSEQAEKGLTGADLFKTGGAKLIESYLNAPQSIASLFGKELYEPFTFGSKYADKIEASIPMKERILNQKNLAFDKTMPTFVDDMDIAPSREELEKMRKDFIEDVDIDTSKNLPFIPLEEDKTELPPIIKSLVKPDETLQDFMANGGRAGFGNGGAVGADDNFAAELEYLLTNENAEIPQLSTYKETANPIELINDIIDPRNIPYYADVLLRSGIRIGEFGARILPATGKLINDLLTKPAFKKIEGTGSGYIQDYDELMPYFPSSIEGTGIFTEFLKNITPTAIEKKVGLDKLIKEEEQKQKDRGSTVGPKVLADTVGLGAEVVAPIFPGLKLIQAYARAKNLPVDRTTEKLLIKEVDQTLANRGMTRREFLAASGATASLAVAKLLGFGDEFARTAKVTEKIAEKAATTGGGVPPYFFQLVEKIKRNGKKLEPEYDPRVENNMTYGGYDMRENMSTGEITITKSTEGEFAGPNDKMYSGVMSDELITYKPGEPVLGKDGKYYVSKDEYEEFTARPDEDGKMKDTEPGLDSIEDIIELLGPNKLKISELENAGYNVDAFPDNIKQLLINDIKKID